MTENDLFLRFPDLRPIEKPPSLGTFNGFGFSVYGRRDTDLETGTYVKTWCVCALFVPILALQAFRVADAQKGWYFLGRVPLSGLAKSWNLLVACLAFATILGVGFDLYRSSPEVQARETMASAEDHVAAGRQVQAAQLWADVLDGGTRQAVTAEEKFRTALSDTVAAGDPGDLAELVDSVQRVGHRNKKQRLQEGLFEKAIEIVDGSLENAPRESLRLLTAITPLAPKTFDAAERREMLLESLVRHEPEDPEPASELALIFEQRGDLERCRELLSPHAERLGKSEGARLLGQIRASEGRLEESRALLLPYTQGRLAKLGKIERAFDKASQEAWDRGIEKLNRGAAQKSWYDRYEAASEEEQARLVQEWVGERIHKDSRVAAAEKALIQEAAIVPVALDLGIVMVQRAHELSSEAERRAELETAEQIFLGIRGFAGEDDEYRLSLGQVYYWLGKPEEGEALLDQLLDAHDRDPETLLGVSSALREVGAQSAARRLAEEAYAAASRETRAAAAHQRALLFTDPSDQLTWYERADSRNPEIRASVFSARGLVASEAGRQKEAVAHYREALDVYRTMTETSASLNNAALVYFQIFSLTGDHRDFRAGAEKMERSVALQPGSRILLGNAASALSQAAVLEVIGEAIDLRMLQTNASFELLSYLYDDEASKREVLGRFSRHEAAVKARTFLEKVLVLAPHEASTYEGLLSLVQGADDEEEVLGSLLERLDETKVDLEASAEKARIYYAGEDAALRKEQLVAYIAQRRAAVERSRERGGVTYAVAATALSGALRQAPLYDLEVDADEVVELAETSYRQSRSAATRAELKAALFFRAGESLVHRSPAWAELIGETRRTLSAAYLIPFVLSRPGELASEARKEPDVLRAAELAREGLRQFQGSASPYDWAILRAIDPAAAADEVAALETGDSSRLRAEVAWRVSPPWATVACRVHWLRLMEGRTREAGAALDATAELGVVLPEELLSSG